MVIQASPGTAVRIAPRDAAVLDLGAAAAGAEVTFSPVGGEDVSAAADASGAVAVPAFQPPALVQATWTEDGIENVLTVEVVQAHYCALDAILSHGGQGDTPADHGAGEPEAWEARARAVETVETAANRRFVPTVAVQDVRADGTIALLDWPDASGIACDDEDVRIFPVGDAAVVASGRMCQDARIVYRAGLPAVPAAIAAAVEELAASYLVPSRIPDRATGESTDAGMLHYTLAGIDGATGIPDVDAAIKAHGRERAAIL